jgi:predicted Zn-dependent peptidase
LQQFLFVGCDQTSQENEQNQQKTEIEKTITDSENTQTISAKVQNLSDGNMLNIAYDIAKLQIETDDYITTLKQSQLNLQQAIQDKNIQSLESATNNLKQELNGLRDVLLSLNLKSGEVDQIRQSLLTAKSAAVKYAIITRTS